MRKNLGVIIYPGQGTLPPYYYPLAEAISSAAGLDAAVANIHRGGALDYGGYLDLAREDLNCNPARSVILVGHSMGGMLALDLCRQHTGRVAGVITLGCGMPYEAMSEQTLASLAGMKDFWDTLQNAGKSFRCDYAIYRQVVANDLPEEEASSFYHDPGLRTETATQAARDAAFGVCIPPSEICGVALCVVAGTQDVLYPPDDQRRLATLYNGEYYEVEAGHLSVARKAVSLVADLVLLMSDVIAA